MSARVQQGCEQSEIDQLIAEIKATPWPNDISAARALFDSDGPPLAADVRVETLAIAGRPAQMLAVAESDVARTILFLHGGGYVYGSLRSHAGLAGELARAGRCKVLQIDYRLAPEHPHPAALEDAVDAYRWLLGQGQDAAGLVLFGDSAGGGLTMALLLALRDRGIALPNAAVCVSPWVDLTACGESFMDRRDMDPMITKDLVERLAGIYAAGADTTQSPISPLFGDMHGLPPLLIQVGEREVLFSEASELATRAQSAGVAVCFEEWPQMIHVWHLYFHRLLGGRQAIVRIGQWILENAAAPAC